MRGKLERLLLTLGLPDWLVLGYLSTVVVGLARATESRARDAYLLFVCALMIGHAAGAFVYRLRVEPRLGQDRASYLASCAYHLLPLATILIFYFNLRPILPIINSATHDAALYRLDLAIFGFEPTIAIERLLSPRVVEWFAFFYYSYFFFVASFIFVMIFTCERDDRLGSFATGVLMIVAIGHYIYTLVPGFGPYAYLAHDYQAPLEGGTFYFLVLEAVSKAGPMRDIFPSLHTALPTFMCLFAWRHYPRVATVATIFAANIILATVVLRWHYAVDVIAGLFLAVSVFLLTPRLVEAYQSRRVAAGLQLRRW